MKIETLEEFVVFAKHLNFSRAAEKMYMSQPALSMHMRSLEKELGISLIDRSNNRMSLTPAGRVFLERCQDMLDIYQKAVAEASAVATAHPPARMLDNKRVFQLHFLAAMVKGVPYSLVNADETMPIWLAIEKDIADMGLTYDYLHIDYLRKRAEEMGIDCAVVGVATMGICVMKSHPLARKNTLTRSDLYDCTIGIGAGAYYDFWEHIVTDLVKPEVPLKFRLDPIESLSNLSFKNFGDVAHIYVLDALKTLTEKRDDIVIFDTIDGKPIETLSVIAYNKKSNNPNVAAFIEKLREVTSDPSYPALPHPYERPYNR